MHEDLTSHLETELKFEAGPEFIVPYLGDLPGAESISEPETFLLCAVYVDTADLRLAAAGITLRRRSGGHDAGWHLKLPVAAAARREVQAPLGGGPAVPGSLAQMVSGWTEGAPLGDIATIDTRRTVSRITGHGGAPLAELADDLVTGRLAGSMGSQSWREIEVELLSGTAEILAAAAARLTAAGARPAGAPSKLARLLSNSP